MVGSLQPYIRLVLDKIAAFLLAAIHAILLLLVGFDDLHVVQKFGLHIFI